MDSEPLERLPLAELIAEERRSQSLSLADVAALVRRSAENEGKHSGATRQTAHNWERGQIPRPDSLRWLACALGIPTERIASAAAKQAAMRRRALLRNATLLAGALLAPDMRSSAPAPREVGAVVLATEELDEVASYLRRVFAEFSTADWLLGPRPLLASVTGHLTLVEQLLARADNDVRIELLHIGARYAEFSSWLHQDVGDSRTALLWADRAMEWAHEAGDSVMVSYVLARKSNQAAAAGDAARALGLARAARQGPERLPGRVQAIAVLQEAHGLALAGDEAACHEKLDEALELIAIGQRNGEGGPGRYCTVEFVELQRASCWIELGSPRRAIESFERGLARLPAVHRRDRGVYLSRLAVAHALDGDPEAASATGLQAVQIAHATGSRRIGTELHRLRSTLAPWRDHPSVAVLDRALAMPA
jgi:transcriptional regulator with XRE-family HTH domain